MTSLNTSDPVEYSRACLERALWQAETGGRALISLFADVNDYGLKLPANEARAGREKVAALTVEFVDILSAGQPAAVTVDMVQVLARQLGLGHIRSWAEMKAPPEQETGR